ncbi:ubiquitin-conjugating enzyme/RWD-like protein [Paraphysoderma sedebokerense]|nr:ubiquitin-conjugating enzyme/RWD-like protein [Paraphysoderma sedebokerense]
MPDTRRITKEIQDCKNDKSCKITIETISESDLTHLKGGFYGSSGTPYEGGYFEVDIVVPNDYPFQPFKMKFITPVYHPNVSSQTGAICLDILKNEWSPVLTLKTTLLSIAALLESPEPDDPQDAVVAAHFKKDPEDFKKTARLWTQMYAKPPSTSDDSAVSSTTKSVSERRKDFSALGLNPDAVLRLVEMGFEEARVMRVLKSCNNDEDRAVEMLLS